MVWRGACPTCSGAAVRQHACKSWQLQRQLLPGPALTRGSRSRRLHPWPPRCDNMAPLSPAHNWILDSALGTRGRLLLSAGHLHSREPPCAGPAWRCTPPAGMPRPACAGRGGARGWRSRLPASWFRLGQYHRNAFIICGASASQEDLQACREAAPYEILLLKVQGCGSAKPLMSMQYCASLPASPVLLSSKLGEYSTKAAMQQPG